MKFKFPIGNRGLKSGGGKRENETIMIIDIHEKSDENFKKDTICSVSVSLLSSYRIFGVKEIWVRDKIGNGRNHGAGLGRKPRLEHEMKRVHLPALLAPLSFSSLLSTVTYHSRIVTLKIQAIIASRSRDEAIKRETSPLFLSKTDNQRATSVIIYTQ